MAIQVFDDKRPNPNRPKIATTEEMVDKEHQIVLNDRRLNN